MVIQHNGACEVKEHDAPLTLEELQHLVSGYIEIVVIHGHKGQMVVNEEGLLKGMRHNPTASDMTVNKHHIVGVAVVPMDWAIQ
jgi:hypothetical protein